jgi:predicted nucleic acid-binding protein
MANRIGFKEFLKKVSGQSSLELIVDANVIIASRDKKHRDYKTIQEFYNSLDQLSADLTLFTTVTTKAEFLEYYRRKILTEGILELYKINKERKVISDRVKAVIENQVRARNLRQNREVQRQEKIEKVLESHSVDTTEFDVEEFSVDANYFKDSEIKEIKKAFRARNVDNESGWITFCNKVLVKRLHALEGELDQLCHYLTTRDKESLKYFTKTDVEWRAATQICGESGMGYSDAMILNMANHTSIEHILTLDFDMVYGGHFSSPSKSIITPTDRLKNYKSILKGI